MGFKIKLKAPKISAPKITVGDPTKIVTNAVSGTVNAATSITGSVLGGVGQVGSQAVGGVGTILSSPGAGALIDGASMAFGLPPGLGSIAEGFAKKKEPSFDGTMPAQIPVYEEAPRQKNNTNLYIAIGAGVLALAVGMIFILKKKRR